MKTTIKQIQNKRDAQDGTLLTSYITETQGYRMELPETNAVKKRIFGHAKHPTTVVEAKSLERTNPRKELQKPKTAGTMNKE